MREITVAWNTAAPGPPVAALRSTETEGTRPAAGAPVTVSREAPPHNNREAREAPPDETRSDETRSDEPADGFLSADGFRLPEAERPHLRALDASLRSLLEVWFDAGLLQLLRVS